MIAVDEPHVHSGLVECMRQAAEVFLARRSRPDAEVAELDDQPEALAGEQLAGLFCDVAAPGHVLVPVPGDDDLPGPVLAHGTILA